MQLLSSVCGCLVLGSPEIPLFFSVSRSWDGHLTCATRESFLMHQCHPEIKTKVTELHLKHSGAKDLCLGELGRYNILTQASTLSTKGGLVDLCKASLLSAYCWPGRPGILNFTLIFCFEYVDMCQIAVCVNCFLLKQCGYQDNLLKDCYIQNSESTARFSSYN